MDYSKYRLTPLEWIKMLLLSLGLAGLVSRLFYDSWLPLAATPLCILFFHKRYSLRGVQRQQRMLSFQFQEAMQTVSNSLLSGYSMENAWREAEKEQILLHGKKALMAGELHLMNRSVGLNMPLEQLLEDFSHRSKVEDIMDFAEVFSFAKRSGGDFIHIIANTTCHMRAKIEVEREIGVLLASKKLEQSIMNIIPMVILAYLKFTSPEYLGSLYGNLFGVLFMTGCLTVYAAVVLAAERILRIQV